MTAKRESPPLRRHLLVLTGLSPQVVTETIYALARQELPWIPDAVHLLTTSQGAHLARESLLGGSGGWFHRICKDYDLTKIKFSASDIHVLRDSKGDPLDDIRTSQENADAADDITRHVQRLTSSEDSSLHVSIAGGRKTMGFYLGYALSLFGREQDRLSHVLVDDSFANHPNFFYPTPYDHIISSNKQGKVIPQNARTATVGLADIAFVRMRYGLPPELRQGKLSFAQAVGALNASLAPVALHFNRERREIEVAGLTLKLPPSEFAIYAAIAWNSKKGNAPLTAPIKDIADCEWSTQVSALLRECGVLSKLPESVRSVLSVGMQGRTFSEGLSRLHSRLQKTFGVTAAAISISDGNVRPRIYSLKLDPEFIKFQ